MSITTLGHGHGHGLLVYYSVASLSLSLSLARVRARARAHARILSAGQRTRPMSSSLILTPIGDAYTAFTPEDIARRRRQVRNWGLGFAESKKSIYIFSLFLSLSLSLSLSVCVRAGVCTRCPVSRGQSLGRQKCDIEPERARDFPPPLTQRYLRVINSSHVIFHRRE